MMDFSQLWAVPDSPNQLSSLSSNTESCVKCSAEISELRQKLYHCLGSVDVIKDFQESSVGAVVEIQI